MDGAGHYSGGMSFGCSPCFVVVNFDDRVSEFIIVETKHLSVHFIFITKEMSSQVIQALNLNKTQFPCDS